jgi:uncharacterized OsmC-like protein
MRTFSIQETIQSWQAEPAKAKGKPAVKAFSEGVQAAFESGSFTWQADFPPALGGTGAAPSPTALFLSALAGCAVLLIRDTLAPQLGIQVEAVAAVAQVETDSGGLVGLAGTIPDFQNLQLTITIKSSEPEAKVQELYQVWLQRCPIYLGIAKGLAIKTTLEVES